jgi:DNA invertase Pin-like site-specific DNA recombinase
VRIATYSRISTDEDHQPYSLEAQAQRLAAYVKSQEGWRLVRRFSDQASGATLERPGLQRALGEAQAKRFDLLLVYRVDRFSRSVRGLAQVLEQLDQAGVLFRSASEPFDTSSSAGRMMVQMLGVFAEFERATIVERVIAGMERKAARGEWTGGSLPFGYRIDAEHRHLEPDETEAPLVREIFERYAERLEGSAALAKRLSERGYRTKNDRPFNPQAVLTILRNRAYLGEINYRGTATQHHTSRSSTPACSSARRRSCASVARTRRCGARTPPTICSLGCSSACAAASATSVPARTATAAATPTTSASPASATARRPATPTRSPPKNSSKRCLSRSSPCWNKSRSCAKQSKRRSLTSTRRGRSAKRS